jgi:hypothetical protein
VTAPTIGVRSWAAEVDLDRVLAALRRRFPRAMIWHGEFTGSLWGAWRDRSGVVHLVEAREPDELRRRLENAGVPLVHPPQAPAVPGAGGMTAGVWSPPTPPPQRTAPPPPVPPRRERPERPERPGPPPPKRPTGGQHEQAPRRGWLRRFLDWLTWAEDWS